MPDVKSGQSMNEYIASCIPVVKREHPEFTQKQAIGQCAGMYRSHKKKARKR